MEHSGCICVFAKPPEAGRVKTRLVPLAGEEGAAALAEAFLQDTLSSVSSLPWARSVVASTSADLRSSLDGSPEIWLQGEGDLGARIERVLRRALIQFPLAIAIGADSPGLPPSYLDQAREALQTADAVIGPCVDGGFYLLGLKKCPDGLLSDIPWSEANTCDTTIARLKSASLTVHVLDPWFDVDRPEDIQRLRSLAAAGAVHVPSTRKILERLFLGAPAERTFTCTVVIPALNEIKYLPHTLAELQKHRWIREVIVADGGSTDGTREWLEDHSFARRIDAPRGKGNQINAGAKAATGDVLLFLHADCLLPQDAGAQIRNALRTERAAGGCFQVRFAGNESRPLKMVAAGINFRTRLTRTATGDQAIFVRRRIFEQIGGCPDWPLFEDVDLVRRIKKSGTFVVVPSRLFISPRRHIANGVFRTVLRIYALRVAFWAGVSPHTLKKWFDDPRPAYAHHLFLEYLAKERHEASHNRI